MEKEEEAEAPLTLSVTSKVFFFFLNWVLSEMKKIETCLVNAGFEHVGRHHSRACIYVRAMAPISS